MKRINMSITFLVPPPSTVVVEPVLPYNCGNTSKHIDWGPLPVNSGVYEQQRRELEKVHSFLTQLEWEEMARATHQHNRAREWATEEEPGIRWL